MSLVDRESERQLEERHARLEDELRAACAATRDVIQTVSQMIHAAVRSRLPFLRSAGAAVASLSPVAGLRGCLER